MTSPGKPTDHLRQDTRHHLLEEWSHDTYKLKHKLAEPTVCTACGAVYHHGHWSWAATPIGASEATCPACQRIADHVPAGLVTLSGAFLLQHEEEITHLIKNIETREKQGHALKRIMAIESQDGGLLISLTDPHLARNIGEAIEHAYKGELDFHYQQGEILLRVSWHRDE